MKIILSFILIFIQYSVYSQNPSLVQDDLVKLVSGFKFLEGPSADIEGNLYFSDILQNKIFVWTTEGTLKTVASNTNWGNGVYVNKKGHIYQCEIIGKQITLYKDFNTPIPIVTSNANLELNSPNDIWILPNGGIYFSDPNYSESITKKNEAVYYIDPTTGKVTQVTHDLLRPNGIVGSYDGAKLYITDHLDNKTWVYQPNESGVLKDKKLFTNLGGDGLTLDNEGNVYITNTKNSSVDIFDASGKLLTEIKIPEIPANVGFGGKNGHTLFITARTSLYAINMRTKWQPKTF